MSSDKILSVLGKTLLSTKKDLISHLGAIYSYFNCLGQVERERNKEHSVGKDQLITSWIPEMTVHWKATAPNEW